ncbi:unnamed protein product [Rhizophagus irregularis]|uniref:Uncharacterized protein n=1 Tax=Rhizophagus irregularis TaxID=588596 RepID=A0A916EC49_9GLOM|nr:unnamed protein product [Rhizophagus irregularis]CAB5379270.1 unnamed protein product [Rhizophagus irregularis]
MLYPLDFNYISAELELDIDNKSLSSQNLNSIALDSNYISEELELDIDTESSTIQNFSTLKKRRNENVETYDNNVKSRKTSLN